MAGSKSKELRERRKVLSESLPALSQKRTDTYRLNSDALALDRAGVKQQAPQQRAQLGEDEVAADAAIRDAQLEIRHLDAQIQSASGLGARVGRAARRVRGG
ncbi:MAG: hypothetical protein E6G32_09455 [Actinobacteria bacterium]|jgi:hypothetical protein|nr:MAG: hypothetical protein E6G64_02660 [Actinomycetota bacterium]TML20572.1 MAG: hypothetical protein E6G32_09455 [Actinomycetota bacterium]